MKVKQGKHYFQVIIEFDEKELNQIENKNSNAVDFVEIKLNS